MARKVKKKKSAKSFAKTKPVAKKKAARATKVASSRSANFALIVPATLKASLAERAKNAGLPNWKAMAQSLLNSPNT